MNRQELMEWLNQPNRIGTLSTSDGKGSVNIGIFGSARMTDENTLVLGLGENRTLQNLEINPRCAFISYEPGPAILAWKGARFYLEVEKIEKEGPLFDQIVEQVTKTAGEMAGKMIKAAVSLKITDIRPLIDLPK